MPKALLAATATLALLFVAAPPLAGAAVRAALPSDFNGDGFADLAVGAEGDDPGYTGAVNVLYGSPTGLTAAGDQLWSQATRGVRGAPGNEDRFGYALASGDFDRDGYADLAIGVPNDLVAGHPHGAVNVLYGTPHGLSAADDQLFSEANLPGVPVNSWRLGAALASADFDGDGFWDLAIGVPGAEVESAENAGAIAVLFGGPDGLLSTTAAAITQDMVGVVYAGSELGWSLAAGDLDGDGHADLAASIREGAVVMYGTPDGPGVADSERWHQQTPGSGHIGLPLEIGDFDADGHDDLAMGVPSEAVEVVYGSASGLVADRRQVWTPDSPAVPGTGPVGGFAFALASGDFDGDGADDLAIGAPAANVGRVSRAGTVTVLRGSSGGLTAVGSQRWTQNSAGVPGTPEEGDFFGWSVASANYGRSGRADLAIGVPRERFGGVPGGIVDVLYGRASGLSGVNAQAWSRATPGVMGAAGRWDFFGRSVAP